MYIEQCFYILKINTGDPLARPHDTVLLMFLLP